MRAKKEIIISIVILILVGGFFALGNVMGTKAELGSKSVSISGPFFSEEIEYDNIEKVTLEKQVDYGTRVAGTDLIGVKTGTFKNKEFGKYKCCINASQNEAVVIKEKNNKFTVFNIKDDDEMEALVLDLNKLI